MRLISLPVKLSVRQYNHLSEIKKTHGISMASQIRGMIQREIYGFSGRSENHKNHGIGSGKKTRPVQVGPSGYAACVRDLSKVFESPFWVTDYPVGSQGFYYLQDSSRPDFLRSMDLLLPDGYGELASGGEREYTEAGVLRQMQRTGEDPARYGWYLEMLREGIPPSAGFGFGIERLTRYVCGAAHIWECSPFPKVPGIV